LSRTTVTVISSFNEEIKKDQYKPLLSEGLLGSDFRVTVFEDGTPEQQINDVSMLEFSTSIKLFEDVFSTDSSYMTVHQAKGLEWDKVIVSVSPTRNDKVKLADFFKDPRLIGEQGNEEFGRIFYVACSRAKTSLYIRIKETEDWNVLKSSLDRLVPAVPFDVAL
jgi:DNA helicase-2/ATP-dependent DNA helicase PcrA